MLNRNIGCIEIPHLHVLLAHKKELNRNIGCIEMHL